MENMYYMGLDVQTNRPWTERLCVRKHFRDFCQLAKGPEEIVAVTDGFHCLIS
jgi:hypothetical protein